MDVDLRTYLETLFEEHRRYHTLEHKTNEHRLEALNELRGEVMKDRQQFLQIATYDAKHYKLVDDVNRIDREIGKIREEISSQKGRSAAFAVVLTVFLVIMSVAVPLLFG